MVTCSHVNVVFVYFKKEKTGQSCPSYSAHMYSAMYLAETTICWGREDREGGHKISNNNVYCSLMHHIQAQFHKLSG